MSREHRLQDRQLANLMKKGLQKPVSPDFDDRLMEMIIAAPAPAASVKQNFALQLGQRYLLLSFGFLVASVFIFGHFLSGYIPDITLWQKLTVNYIFFGGFILFFLMIFFLLDALLTEKYATEKLSGVHGM